MQYRTLTVTVKPTRERCLSANARLGDCKFVASQACNHVDLAHCMLQASSHCLQELVSGGTAVLGAVILMGLLGGAMTTQLRIDNPLFSHILFSLYLGLFMWGGLWLRDPKLRAIFPIQRS